MPDPKIETPGMPAPAPKAPIIVSPEEIVALYDHIGANTDDPNVRGGQWNRHLSAWANPSHVARALWSYGRSLACRVVEAVHRLTAVEHNVSDLIRRVADLEAFRQDLLANAQMQAEAVAREAGITVEELHRRMQNGEPITAAAAPATPAIPVAPAP